MIIFWFWIRLRSAFERALGDLESASISAVQREQNAAGPVRFSKFTFYWSVLFFCFSMVFIDEKHVWASYFNIFTNCVHSPLAASIDVNEAKGVAEKLLLIFFRALRDARKYLVHRTCKAQDSFRNRKIWNFYKICTKSLFLRPKPWFCIRSQKFARRELGGGWAPCSSASFWKK